MRTRLIVRALSSGGSRHGKTVISALGASDATSIEVGSGCDDVSSGKTRIGVRQLLMNVARHAVEEIGLHAEEAVEIFLDRLRRHLGPSCPEIREPILLAVSNHDVRVFGPMAHGLAEHGGHDALRRPLQQLAGEAAADAVAHEEEFADPEMVHQPKLVVGECVPRVLDRHRTGGTRRHWHCAGPW